MLQPLRVELPTPRYAMTVVTLRRARRAWHRADTALVEVRAVAGDGSALAAVQEALASLDGYLDHLAVLLGSR